VAHANPKTGMKESDGQSSVHGIFSFDMDVY
jgi:hypothetical protein